MKMVLTGGKDPGSAKCDDMSWSAANIPFTAIPIMSSPRFSDWWTATNYQLIRTKKTIKHFAYHSILILMFSNIPYALLLTIS